MAEYPIAAHYVPDINCDHTGAGERVSCKKTSIHYRGLNGLLSLNKYYLRCELLCSINGQQLFPAI